MGVDGVLVQKAVDSVKAVLRKYFAFLSVVPIHEAAVGGIP